MKKLLLFLIMSFVSILNGQYESPPFNPDGKLGTEGSGSTVNSADISKDFLIQEKNHKEAWFDFAQKKHTEKFELLKKQHDKWFDVSIKNIDDVAAISSKQGAQETILNHFKKAYEIVGQNMEEWKELCEKEYNEGMKLYNQHKADHAKFKKYTTLH